MRYLADALRGLASLARSHRLWPYEPASFFLLIISFAVIALVGCISGAGPPILARFGDYYFDGKPRVLDPFPHRGLDLAAGQGEPVLAPADGMVTRAWVGDACGDGVIISHEPLGFWTQYCHLTPAFPKREGRVKRGEVIGFVGRTGILGPNDRTHLHFEVLKYASVPVDPEQHIVGCFDPDKTYPADKFVLTWPLRC